MYTEQISLKECSKFMFLLEKYKYLHALCCQFLFWYFRSGDKCDPEDDKADSVECVLIYDTTDYKLMRRIANMSFCGCVYFKVFTLGYVESSKAAVILAFI